MLKRIASTALAGAMLVAGLAHAQQTGELWEMTSQMSMQGMPAGMIPAQTQQVCQSKAFDRTPGQEDPSKCKITNLRQSPTRIQYDVRCEGNPPMTGSADYTFEANRTRMKGTMRVVSKDGEMTMQLTGRKVGSCDPAETRRAQNKQVEDAKKQHAAIMKQADDEQIRGCRQSLEKMEPSFGVVGICARRSDQECKAMMGGLTPPVKNACTANMKEYCGRYQTRDGLLRIGTSKARLEQTASLCGQSLASVRAKLCPAAVKDDALPFIAQQCPVEAKAIAQRECGGRAFTVAKGSRYGEFCAMYRGTLADAGGDDAPSSAAASQPAPQSPSQPAPADAASQAIQEGLGKLKGLFGR